MKQLRTLVAMQLRDKIELGFIKKPKELLRTIIFALLKFLIVTVVVIGILYISGKFIFIASDIPRISILVLGVLFGLTLIGCTVELMKNLFLSDDNRVLITLPVDANKIFVSKIIVFFIYELKKSLALTIPFILGLSIYMSFMYQNPTPKYILFWIILPTLLIISIIVLLSSLLSIIAMFIYRFLKRYSIIEIILFLLILALSVWGIVSLIKMIPTDIDLINQWPVIKPKIMNKLIQIEKDLSILSNFVYTLIGEYNPSKLNHVINLTSFVKLLILFGVNIVLFVLAYFISRPFFFKMMSKSFEINKSLDRNKPNKQRNKYFTFINKEFLINLRTINISMNYLIVYIAIPILVLFLNVIYKAMDTRDLGKILIYTFNVLIILLPLLASNGLVATYYSLEGRAAYIKKTKPIFAIYPLCAKLFFNLVFSIPAVFVTVWIFGRYSSFNAIEIFTLGLGILFIHFGHMIYSAQLDIMNPQNEQYATIGTQIDNPNESKSTLMAFVISIVLTIFAFKLFSEASLANNIASATVKIMGIGIAFVVSMLVLFVKRIKAFYYSI